MQKLNELNKIKMGITPKHVIKQLKIKYDGKLCKHPEISSISCMGFSRGSVGKVVNIYIYIHE